MNEPVERRSYPQTLSIKSPLGVKFSILVRKYRRPGLEKKRFKYLKKDLPLRRHYLRVHPKNGKEKMEMISVLKRTSKMARYVRLNHVGDPRS